MKIRSLYSIIVLSIALVLGFCKAYAEYPEKPINLYIGFKAGGGTDTVGRVLAKVLGEELGQQVNIINKPGSGGCVAAMQVARMAADGYNLVMDPSSSISWERHTNEKCAIEISDLDYLGMIAQFNFGLVANKDAPYNNIEEFFNWAEGKKVSYVMMGSGTKALMKYVAAEKNVDVNYVPAKGGADMISLVLGNQVDLSWSGGIHTRYPDKIKLIASVADYRHQSAPQIKTLKESGINITAGAFHTVAGPKGLPEDVISKIESAMKKAYDHPTMKDISAKTKFPLVYKNSAEATAEMIAQNKSYEVLTKVTSDM